MKNIFVLEMFEPKFILVIVFSISLIVFCLLFKRIIALNREFEENQKVYEFTDDMLRECSIKNGRWLVDSYGREHVIYEYNEARGTFKDQNGNEYIVR